MLEPEKCPSEVNFWCSSMLDAPFFNARCKRAFENRQIVAKIMHFQSNARAKARSCSSSKFHFRACLSPLDARIFHTRCNTITHHEAFSCWVFSWNWNYLLSWDPLCFEKTSFLSSTYLLQGSFFAEIATGFVKDLKSISFGVRHLCEHKKPQKNTLSCVSNVCIFMLKKMGRSISGQGKNKKIR